MDDFALLVGEVIISTDDDGEVSSAAPPPLATTVTADAADEVSTAIAGRFFLLAEEVIVDFFLVKPNDVKSIHGVVPPPFLPGVDFLPLPLPRLDPLPPLMIAQASLW